MHFRLKSEKIMNVKVQQKLWYSYLKKCVVVIPGKYYEL